MPLSQFPYLSGWYPSCWNSRTWKTYIYAMKSLWPHLFYQRAYSHFPTQCGETKFHQLRKTLKSFKFVNVLTIIPHMGFFLISFPKIIAYMQLKPISSFSAAQTKSMVSSRGWTEPWRAFCKCEGTVTVVTTIWWGVPGI